MKPSIDGHKSGFRVALPSLQHYLSWGKQLPLTKAPDNEIMNMLKVFVFLLLASMIFPLRAESYSDCILENMKNAGSESAANAIRVACRKKALPQVPAICKPLAEPSGEYYSLSHPYHQCINSCLDANFWSKHFGDCKP